MKALTTDKILALFAIFLLICALCPPLVLSQQPSALPSSNPPKIAAQVTIPPTNVIVKVPGSVPTTERIQTLRTEDVLELNSMEVPKNRTISDLLVSQGIKPDAYSYGLIMDLNPQMSNIKRILAGGRVTLPKVKRYALGLTKLYSWARFAIASNADERQMLKVSVARLRESVDQVSHFTSNRFVSPDLKSEFTTKFVDSNKKLEQLKFLPINKRTIERSARLASSLTAVVQDAGNQLPITADDLATVNDIHQELDYMTERAEAGDNQRPVYVSIRTVKVVDGQKVPAPNLTVRCRLGGDYRIDKKGGNDPHLKFIPFDNLTSPALKELDDGAYYFFWVVNETTKQIVRDAEVYQVVRSQYHCDPEHPEREFCREWLVQPN
jgi:hypothetical protein